MGDFYTNPVRHPEDVGVGCIRRTVTWDQSNTDANGIAIGALEAGCRPLGCHVTITTAYNAGTTNVLVVGTVDDDDGFATSASVIAGTPGYKPSLVGALSGVPLAASKIVYAKFTQTGTAASAGKAVISLHFENKRELEGIPFPNN